MSWFLRRQDQTRWDSSLTTTTEACDLVIWSWYQLIPCTIDVMWVMWSFLIQSNWFDICLNGPVVFAFYPRINTTPYHESPSLLTALSEGRQKAGNYSPAAGFPREEDRHQSSTKKPLLRIISSSQRLGIWFIQEDVDTVKGAGFAEEKTCFFFTVLLSLRIKEDGMLGDWVSLPTQSSGIAFMGGVGTRKGFEHLLIPLEKTIERTSTESTSWQDIREPSAVGLRFGVGNS